MTKEFVDWLTSELNKRGWSNSELRRRTDNAVANSTISMVLSGQSNPGWDFCAAVAEAFGEPPEKIFRLAGLLPPLPASEDTPTLREIIELSKRMTPEQREQAADYIRYLYQKEQEEKRAQRGANETPAET